MTKSNKQRPDDNQLIASSVSWNQRHGQFHKYTLPSAYRSQLTLKPFTEFSLATLSHWIATHAHCSRPLVYLRRLRFVSHALSPTPLCVSRLFADHVVCRTLSTTVLFSVLSTQEPHSTSTVRRHRLFGPHFVCTINIIIHVVQLKLHSSNYNHITIMHSITHNIIPVHIVI